MTHPLTDSERQEAMRWLNENYPDAADDTLVRPIILAAWQASRAAVPEGWINVNDDVPDSDYETVLCYGVTECTDGVRQYGVFMSTLAEWEKELQYFKDAVTHWMPIPPAPKEEG